MKDTIFVKKKTEDFSFNKEVADVFDDMLLRSVPFYSELQRMMSEIAKYFYQKGTKIYDLGCSTGTTLLSLMDAVAGAQVVGVDNSQAMLQKVKERINRPNLSLIEADLNKMDFEISNASVVTMNWTLQFVRPLYRESLVKKIYKGMVKQGVFLLSEKILVEPSVLNRLYIELYYNFKKKKGYSEREISRKREALENVLIPYRREEDFELLKRSGFKYIDTMFRWYNWATFICIKGVI